MKRVASIIVFTALAILLLLTSALSLGGCGDTTTVHIIPAQAGEAEILAFKGGLISGDTLYYEVDADTDRFDLNGTLTLSEGSVWTLSLSDEGRTPVESGVVKELRGGENRYFVTVDAANGAERIYELTLFRNHFVTISYFLFGTLYETGSALTHTYLTDTPIPTAEGYDFVGWEGDDLYVEGPLRLDAIMRGKSYVATLDSLDGDRGVTTKEVTFGRSYSLGIPDRMGFIFAGWYHGASAVTDFAGDSLSGWDFACDTTLTARWLSETTSAASGDKTITPGWWGTYPQTRVTDTKVLNGLNYAAGALPTVVNQGKWTSYNYYAGGTSSNYMWYIDTTYGGARYRGVYFTSYRPNDTAGAGNTNTSNQDNNGYTPGNVYWFAYETIVWRIHRTRAVGSYTYFYMSSEKVIDAQPFRYDTEPHGSNTAPQYSSNNYHKSDIRTWLNGTFYNTAFSSTEKANTLTAEQANAGGLYLLHNTPSSANPSLYPTFWNGGLNQYCYDLNSSYSALLSNRIFLLSEQDVTTESDGYDTTIYSRDMMRRRAVTDYAQAQGAFKSTETGYKGYGSWWLRSPSYAFPMQGRVVGSQGDDQYFATVNAINGVVPGICVRV